MSQPNPDIFVGWLNLISEWGTPVVAAIVSWWATRRASGKKCEQVTLRLLIAIENRELANDPSRSDADRMRAQLAYNRAIREAKVLIYGSLGMKMEDFND